MTDFKIIPNEVHSATRDTSEDSSIRRTINYAKLREISMETSCKENAPVQSYQKVVACFFFSACTHA